MEGLWIVNLLLRLILRLHNIYFSKGLSVAEILKNGWESVQSTWTHWCDILKLRNSLQATCEGVNFCIDKDSIILLMGFFLLAVSTRE